MQKPPFASTNCTVGLENLLNKELPGYQHQSGHIARPGILGGKEFDHKLRESRTQRFSL
jgi:hypothetical protein